MRILTNRPCFRLGITAIFAVAVPLAAHIVPPEEIHPVAESYRRSGFVLGLNPVLWDQVQTDANVIAAGLEIVDPERAAEFVAAIEASIARGRVGEADSRRAESDEIFVLTTRAVASLISQHLERARSAIERGDDAVVDLEEARQLWAAFEREIRYTDGASYVRLGRCWLELYAALGNPGLGGMSGLPADAKAFAEEAAEIVDYLDESYVNEPRAARPSKLAVPANSPTYDGNQTLPPYLPPTSEINKQLPRPRQVLNMAERGVDETETTLIALGDMVFDSPEIFGDPARSLGLSCNSCHNKSITNPNLFVPGLSSRSGGIDVDNAFFAPHANDGVFDPLDIPDLRGIRFTAPYGRDGRFDSLREFSRNVIVNEFNGAEPEPEMLDGLIAYMLQFDFLPNPLLNDNGTLTPDTPESARRGEVLFNRTFERMGNRSCASCHIPSDHFIDRQRHDIGSVAKSVHGARDGALDTPTLLSSLYNAPYFHDGSLATLGEVVDWFDQKYHLGLTSEESADLTAYLEVVGSGIDSYEDTIYTLEAELEEFSFFLSTWDYLISRDLERLVEITLQTVAFEIRAHKWDIQDRELLPVLDQLAGLIDDAGEAFNKGDIDAAEARLGDYRSLYEEYREVLK